MADYTCQWELDGAILSNGIDIMVMPPDRSDGRPDVRHQFHFEPGPLTTMYNMLAEEAIAQLYESWGHPRASAPTSFAASHVFMWDPPLATDPVLGGRPST